MSGGELFDHIVSAGRLSPDESRSIFQQVGAWRDEAHRGYAGEKDYSYWAAVVIGPSSTRRRERALFLIKGVSDDYTLFPTLLDMAQYVFPILFASTLAFLTDVDIEFSKGCTVGGMYK